MVFSMGLTIGSWIKTLTSPGKAGQEVVALKPSIMDGVSAVVFAAVVSGTISFLSGLGYGASIGAASVAFVLNLILSVVFMFVLGTVYIIIAAMFGGKGTFQGFLPPFAYIFSAFMVASAVVGLFAAIPIFALALSVLLLIYFILVVSSLIRLSFGLDAQSSLIVAAIPPVALAIIAFVLLGLGPSPFGYAFGHPWLGVAGNATNATNGTAVTPPKTKLCTEGEVKNVNGISVTIHGLRNYEGRMLCYATAEGASLSAYNNVEIYFNTANSSDFAILINGQEYPLNLTAVPGGA